jgi:hypothetical protein
VSQSRGRPLRLHAGDAARLWSKVTKTSTCWIFTKGSVGSDGYGRFSLRQPGGGRERMVTPHQVAAVLAFGELEEGATLLHDCDVRLCVRTGPGHVRVGTQAENMRQAARRGRARGPRPGLVDVRGRVEASRAIQKALRASTDRSPDGLARVLAEALAAGDPLRHNGRLWG